jgi:hypothetical protein
MLVLKFVEKEVLFLMGKYMLILLDLWVQVDLLDRLVLWGQVDLWVL